MLTLRRLRLTAHVLLAALLFAHAALAIAACDLLRRAPAQAFTAAQAPTCHAATATNANLCLAHCLGGDQSADKPPVPSAAFAAIPVLVVSAAPAPAMARDVRGEIPHLGPPPRIRFHSFRI